MRAKNIFLKTQKEIKKEAKIPSFRFLTKASFIHQTGAGLFSLLPLGFIVFKKIEKIIREELEKAGCQEILMPVVQPALLWRESGRYEEVGPELLKIKANEADLVLAMTAEEVVTDIARYYLKSYQDLPVILNQFQTKFRNEPRPRGGLIRLKEFMMQDAYSFDKDEKGLENSYQKMKKAYQNIFKKIGLKTILVSAFSGMMGGEKSEEFMVLSNSGEDETVLCSKCSYAANIQTASSISQRPKKISKFKKIEEIKTPKMKTVNEVAEYLKIDPSVLIKSMVYKRGDKLILVLIRGDLEVNEDKLKSVFGANLLPATEKDCQKQGINLGFVGPVGLPAQRGLKNVEIIADFSLKLGGPYVVGGNKIDTHLVGVTPKDFGVDKWLDLAKVKEGDICSKCGGKLTIKKSIELGHLFKLGTKYSEKMKAYFVDRDGKRKPILMGCYGIGLERVMAAIVETHYDENGIIWPKSIAPFPVYLLSIITTDRDKKIVENLYQKLIDNKIGVLYDDRDKTAGFKFAEADLIGCPLRLTISRRSLEKNCIEIKERDKKEARLIKLNKVVEEVKNYLSEP